MIINRREHRCFLEISARTKGSPSVISHHLRTVTDKQVLRRMCDAEWRQGADRENDGLTCRYLYRDGRIGRLTFDVRLIVKT